MEATFLCSDRSTRLLAPVTFPGKAASMDHATCARQLSTTPFARSLATLTVQLLPVIAEIGRLIVSFRRAELTPQATHRFEIELQRLLRELGRIILEWTYNDLEPQRRQRVPGSIMVAGQWYRRRSKTANRTVATVFGTITLWRYLYQPLDGTGPSIFPLELRLGLEARLATPALAERVALAAVATTQNEVRAALDRDHGVSWSVASLRKVIAGVSAGMEPHRHDAQAAVILGWLDRANRSSGPRKPVLAVGRDGLMLPLRGAGCYREGATATVSVYDRRGRRLGTVYLGRMPEPGQEALSRQLTALVKAVLGGWTGPPPRLAYITDGGSNQAQYYRRVLKRMDDPRRPGVRLKWQWVIDFYHASEYVYELAEALFSDVREGESWARKMCHWLKAKPRGIYRVLHSAAAIRQRRAIMVAAKREQYRSAYAYLRKRIGLLDYSQYRQAHLPIGSGVTEAACKTVFTQRLKQSGMTWKTEGGQWIVDLRVIYLSGIWTEVYRAYLGSKATLAIGSQGTTGAQKPAIAA
jgi:hypothetical protein